MKYIDTTYHGYEKTSCLKNQYTNMTLISLNIKGLDAFCSHNSLFFLCSIFASILYA